MISPLKKSKNNMPSIKFNQAAERTAKFLPAIQSYSLNTTPRNNSFASPLAQQHVNGQQQINIITNRINNDKNDVSKSINLKQKQNQIAYQQNLLEGIQQRYQIPQIQQDQSQNCDAHITTNQINNRNKSPLSTDTDDFKKKIGTNTYNNRYGYKVDQDIKLNSSNDVNVNNYKRMKPHLQLNRFRQNSSQNSGSNSSRQRNQSIKNKPKNQNSSIISTEFFNQNYTITPASDTNGQIDNQLQTKENQKQVKTLSNQNGNNSSSYEQNYYKADYLQTQPSIIEQSHSLQNQTDSNKQEQLQEHLETNGNRGKSVERFSTHIRSESKRDHRFPLGFFAKTPNSSKRRTIRLNQNIYETPLEKPQQKIQNFSLMNDHQFTFGDEDGETPQSKIQFDIYRYALYSKDNTQINNNQFQTSQQINMDIQQNHDQSLSERTKNIQLQNLNQKQMKMLNQQITKNEIYGNSNPNEGDESSINTNRKEETLDHEKAYVNILPSREYHSSMNQYQNINQQHPINQNPMIESPVLDGSASRYSKPKSLIFKKIFEKMNQLIGEQKRKESVCFQSNNTLNSPICQIDNMQLISLNKQESIQKRQFDSRQSSKSRQYKSPRIRKSNSPFVLEPLQNIDDYSYKNSTIEDLDSSHLNGYRFNSPTSLQNSRKDVHQINENQLQLNFKKKFSIIPKQINGSILQEINKNNSNQLQNLQNLTFKQQKSIKSSDDKISQQFQENNHSQLQNLYHQYFQYPPQNQQNIEVDIVNVNKKLSYQSDNSFNTSSNEHYQTNKPNENQTDNM